MNSLVFGTLPCETCDQLHARSLSVGLPGSSALGDSGVLPVCARLCLGHRDPCYGCPQLANRCGFSLFLGCLLKT